MNRKEIIFLLANIPFCIGLYFLFLFLTIDSGYPEKYGYGIIVWHLLLFYSLLNLIIDIAVIWLLKLLSRRIVFLTFIEVSIFYLIIKRYFA
jgi:hypothetical protein